MKTLEQHIEETMDWFDFNQVKKVMDFLDWKWSNGGVPEIAEMRQLVRKFMKDLYTRHENDKKVNSYIGSGGFFVRYVKDVDKNGPWDRFFVAFQIEEWYTGE